MNPTISPVPVFAALEAPIREPLLLTTRHFLYLINRFNDHPRRWRGLPYGFQHNDPSYPQRGGVNTLRVGTLHPQGQIMTYRMGSNAVTVGVPSYTEV